MKNRAGTQYFQIYESLKDEIASGKYGPGAMLPFERELCERYSAQRITVRHALELLVNDGLIYKRPGVGSFVSDPALPAEGSEPVLSHLPENRKTVLFIMMRNLNDVRNNSNAYNSQLFFTMERACRAQGLSLLFLPVRHAADLRQRIESDPPICALLVSHTDPDIRDCLLQASIPVIVMNSIDERIISIMPDNFTGTTMAMESLFSMGHDKIAFIGGIESYDNAKERFLAYRIAYWTRGLPLREQWIHNADWTYDGGKKAMQALMALPEEERPTAVFCASDMMAVGTYEVIQAASLVIGRDISVMGFDNVPMCDYVLPHLSTIDVSLDQMTRVATEHMLAAIAEKANTSGPYVVRIPATLLQRSSCGQLRQDNAPQ